jgi:hypothetical protein
MVYAAYHISHACPVVQSNAKDGFAFLWEHAIFGCALNKNPCTDRHESFARFITSPVSPNTPTLVTIRPLGGAVAKIAMKWTMFRVSYAVLCVSIVSCDGAENVACKIIRCWNVRA